MGEEPLNVVREQQALFHVLNQDTEKGTSFRPAMKEDGRSSNQSLDTIQILPPADVLETLA